MLLSSMAFMLWAEEAILTVAVHSPSRAGERRLLVRIVGMQAVVIALRENFFQPEIKDDEEIAAAHLGQLQLRDAVLAVGPTDGDDGVRITADDCLQRHFHREVEMRRDERL